MVQYKLIYYNTPGRAETSRMLFALAGVAFEDYRMKDKFFQPSPDDEWPSLKPTTPFGQLPVLVVDGKMHAQSNAIARYLANKFGFAGKTHEEALACDSIVDHLDDVMSNMKKFFFEQDEAKKAAMKAEFLNKKLPAGLKYLEGMVQSSGFLVGGAITWADVGVFVFVHDIFPALKPEKPVLDGFPKLKALVDKVSANERIAAWIAKRPKTEY